MFRLRHIAQEARKISSAVQNHQCIVAHSAQYCLPLLAERKELLPQDLSTASFRSCSLLLDRVEVQVQSMGESITEGTIAAVLKKEGEGVSEDETIAQIETDKVTIDVKAPVAGRVVEMKVTSEDTVKVGQVVAVISEGEERQTTTAIRNQASDKEGAETVPQKSNKKEEISTSESSSTSSGAEHTGTYQPQIRFPKRMTEDGKRISELSEEDRKQYLGKESRQPTASSHREPKKKSEKRSRLPWYAGKEQGTKLSQSRVLSQKEMEQIELGGADPF